MQVGHVGSAVVASWEQIKAVTADLDSPLRCVDPEVQEQNESRKWTRRTKRATPLAEFLKLWRTMFQWDWEATRNGTKSSTVAWRRR